ncbi:Alpha/Beta hydrolase protein [Cercophora newfieldiana]|uniref:Alpha/Beta hydrolase protein n=1 Tax=Cercophora newfieldiana TaxID=92897 RepID=A0AA39XZA8_9PEZI|nr:Alpha/Beta hydrolase protein [Cercophora newfieldiana]
MATSTPPTETTPLNPPPSQPASESQEEEPFFLSLNPSQPTTLIFLHGVTSSHLEWAHILPLLPQYHLLVLDMPGHSRSSHLPGPYTIPRMADVAAGIIARHAHNGVAHVVGLSMGGFTALELARRYPELCTSVFATGAHPFEGTYAWLAARPRVVSGFMWVLYNLLPDALYWGMARWGGMRRHEELHAEMRRNSARFEVISGVYGSILDVGWEEFKQMDKVRTLVVAAEKGDDVRSAEGVARVWREEGVQERVGSRVAVVKGALHAWDLQFPELFAEGIRAWVEGGELPEGFEVVE